jgi:hypothetical protein
MTRELVALLDGKEIGRVHGDARGRTTFVYDEEWQNAANAYPLSLSAPRSRISPPVRAFARSGGSCRLRSTSHQAQCEPGRSEAHSGTASRRIEAIDLDSVFEMSAHASHKGRGQKNRFAHAPGGGGKK